MLSATQDGADLAARYERVDWGAIESGDHMLNQNEPDRLILAPRRSAAVLVPVLEREELTILLTRRADTLRQHAGQIAFPGGALDPGETATEAALREANEEVGLEPVHVRRIVGPLPRYATGSGFDVTPVLALVDPAFVPVPSPAEVAETFEVPLHVLMRPDSFEIGEAEWRGRLRRYYAIHHSPAGRERRIWGATAGILKTMADRLYP